jgi:hypothetical protein
LRENANFAPAEFIAASAVRVVSIVIAINLKGIANQDKLLYMEAVSKESLSYKLLSSVVFAPSLPFSYHTLKTSCLVWVEYSSIFLSSMTWIHRMTINQCLIY